MIVFQHYRRIAYHIACQVGDADTAGKRPVYGKIKDTPPRGRQAIDVAWLLAGAFGRRACRAKTKHQYYQTSFRHRVNCAQKGRRP
jgi:hypothetical protein